MTQQDYPLGPTSPWISIADAAEWTGLGTDDVREAIDAGDLKAIRLGVRLVRVAEREVGELFELPLPGPRELQIAAERDHRTPQPKIVREVVDHWLYWFYDESGLLLYIGITNSGVRRMEQHGAEKEWWPQVATIKIDHFATRTEAEAAEVEAIQTYLPIHNVRDSVRFQKGRLC